MADQEGQLPLQENYQQNGQQNQADNFTRPKEVSADETNRLSRLKEVAQQSLDVALLTSNATTLRFVVDTPNLEHRTLLITLLSLSIAVTLTLSIVLMTRLPLSVEKTKAGEVLGNRKKAHEIFKQRRDESININHKICSVVAALLAVVSVALNVFITAFNPRSRNP